MSSPPTSPGSHGGIWLYLNVCRIEGALRSRSEQGLFSHGFNLFSMSHKSTTSD